MDHFRRMTRSNARFATGTARFEHWYRDHTAYFITARTREGFCAFETDEAKSIFWDRFDYWSKQFGYVEYVTTLLNNHYHTEGYLPIGEDLGRMMQRIHGSVAKLGNDVLPERRLPFWREAGKHDYFDGCLRDETQCRLAYRYTLMQSVKAGIVRDWRDYPQTRVSMEVDDAVKHALAHRGFMEGIEYKRYKQYRKSAR
jgi:hypothetical protein